MDRNEDTESSDLNEAGIVNGQRNYTFLFERLFGIADSQTLSIPELPLVNSKIVQFYTFMVLFEYMLLKSLNHWVGYPHSLILSPITVVIPVGVLIGAASLHYFNDRYKVLLSDLHKRGNIAETTNYRINSIVTFRRQVGIYTVLIAIYWWFLFFRVDIITLFMNGLIIDVFAYFFLNSFVYIPLIADFLIVYTVIQLILPLKLISSNGDFNLFFYDPRDLGGLGRLGELMKESYYVYALCLMLYLLMSYGPYIFPNLPAARLNPPGRFQAILFTSAWAFGTGIILISLHKIRKFVQQQKEEKLSTLESRVRNLQDDPYDLNRLSVGDNAKYESIQHNIKQIKNTREYPLTLTMWIQIIISVVLPQILQVVLQQAV